MGQIEVYEYLKNVRRKCETFKSAKEVQEALGKKGLSLGLLWGVPGDLLSLERRGYVEAELRWQKNRWVRTFRLMKKYVKN